MDGVNEALRIAMNEQARHFLQLLRPHGGLVTLTAAHNGGYGGLPTMTFELPGELSEALAWLELKAGHRCNLYYQLQIVRDRLLERLGKTNVEAVPFLHLDFDWKNGSFKLAATPGMIADKVAELQGISVSPGRHCPPSIIVCSGNGVQALWRLETPADITTAERANKHLLDALGGDPGTYDGARMLRLPGFTNWPRLKHRYLDPSPTYLIEANANTYPVETFPLAPPEAIRKHCEVIADAVEVDDAALEGLPSLLVEIIRTGSCTDGEHSPRDQSRSGWCMYGTCWLVGCGIEDGVILGILSNELWCIGDGLRNSKGRSFEDAARRTLARAKEFVAERRAKELADLFGEEKEELDFTADAPEPLDFGD